MFLKFKVTAPESDFRLVVNLLVQSIRDNGTFYLNSISTKFLSTFSQNMKKKKINNNKKS